MNIKKRKKYFIQQFMQEEYLHGGVGITDAEKILLAKGFEPVLFPHQHNFSLAAKLSRFFFLIKMFFKIRNGAVLVFLFPLYARMNTLLLYFLRKKKGVSLVCFITDINGMKDGDEKLLEKEIRFLKQFGYFIVHNDSMKEWLYKNGLADRKAVAIGFFDFLTAPVSGQRDITDNIVFAGNLEKSFFLKELHLLGKNNSALHFHLYGAGQGDEVLTQRNVTWHGVEKPYDLPGKLHGSFGLLWDGDSIDKPGGNLGYYMHFISHHKLSLYILSKLPVIAPASAGSAPLIEKYRIGILVNSMYEIEGRISTITRDEYQQMQCNMQPLAEKISKGECLGTAMDEIMKWL